MDYYLAKTKHCLNTTGIVRRIFNCYLKCHYPKRDFVVFRMIVNNIKIFFHYAKIKNSFRRKVKNKKTNTHHPIEMLLYENSFRV